MQQLEAAQQLLISFSAGKQGQSKATPLKQKALEGFLAAHTAMVYQIQRKYPSASSYCYIETNAGSGWNDSVHVEGSPLVALRALTRRDGLRFQCWFIEKDMQSAQSLRGRIPDHTHDVICEDNVVALPGLLNQIPRGAYGLIYVDPNKPSETPTEALRTFFANHTTRKIDVLININAHALRRVIAAQQKGANAGNYEDLRGMMRRIGKSHWWIRDTVTSPGSRWTFLYGANTPNFKIKGLGKVGLDVFPVDSQTGSQMLATLMGEARLPGKQ